MECLSGMSKGKELILHKFGPHGACISCISSISKVSLIQLLILRPVQREIIFLMVLTADSPKI